LRFFTDVEVLGLTVLLRFGDGIFALLLRLPLLLVLPPLLS